VPSLEPACHAGVHGRPAVPGIDDGAPRTRSREVVFQRPRHQRRCSCQSKKPCGPFCAPLCRKRVQTT
jgi:hypothetical protein